MDFIEKISVEGLRLLKQRIIRLRWLICFIRLDLHQEWIAESSTYSEVVVNSSK